MEDARAQEERETALLGASKAMIDASKLIGRSRSDTRALMVHPDDDQNSPGVIFDMLWPEGE